MTLHKMIQSSVEMKTTINAPGICKPTLIKRHYAHSGTKMNKQICSTIM